MSEPAAPAPRPVSPLTVAAVFGCFALFLVPLYYGYVRHRPPVWFLPESGPAQNLPASDAWQATAAGRLAYLHQLRAAQEKQATTYAWVDRKAGVVQLPIARAMELVVQRRGRTTP
jgi:hypothetical protein